MTASEDALRVLLPPPNLTGGLHLGHGFSFTLLDTYVRYWRAKGRAVHFHPGTEHAGERAREAHRRYVRNGGTLDFEPWLDDIRRTITSHLKMLRIDADWDAEYYSMDEARVSFMQRAFADLHERGFIYPSRAMVNWCPCCATAVPDIDVKFRPQACTSHELSHPALPPGVTLLTHALEYVLGATGLAISSSHAFASNLEGSRVSLAGRQLVVALSSHERLRDIGHLVIVNPSANPGDFQDWSGLDEDDSLYAPDGRLAARFTAYAAGDLAASRALIARRLTEEGWRIESRAQTRTRPYCGVCLSDVQPRITEQWFFDLGKAFELELAHPDFHSPIWQKGFELWIQKLKSPIPNRYHEVMDTAYYGGFSSNRDLLVSSQCGWGQPLPVWRCAQCRARQVCLSPATVCPACQGERIERVDGVISIFFSCCLMGPSTHDLPNKHHAVDFTVCGHDIYHYWGSLKTLLATALGYRAGFGSLLVHGLLVDADGRKMTKSEGNVIPLEEILHAHGVETLRSLVYDSMSTHHDKPFIRFDLAGFEPAGAFVDWLRNTLKRPHAAASPEARAPLTSEQVREASASVDRLMQAHRVGHAYQEIKQRLLASDGLFDSRQARQAFVNLLKPFHPDLASDVESSAA